MAVKSKRIMAILEYKKLRNKWKFYYENDSPEYAVIEYDVAKG